MYICSKKWSCKKATRMRVAFFRCCEKRCLSTFLSTHFEILKWAHNNGCDWDRYTCAFAAANGHLDIIKWVRKNGCEWDSKTCENAAINGHLRVLKWVHQHGCPWDIQSFENIMRYAEDEGYREIIKYMKKYLLT
jgi:hypothetical protein